MTDEEIEADCALSPSRVSPSSCWQTPLLLGTLTGPQQRCLHPPGCWHSKQLQQVQAVDRTCAVCFTLPHQKKKKKKITGFTVTHCLGACSTARESSICCLDWKLSVFTFGTEVTLHLWTAVKPERSQTLKTCTYRKELQVPPWNTNSLVHLQRER